MQANYNREHQQRVQIDESALHPSVPISQACSGIPETKLCLAPGQLQDALSLSLSLKLQTLHDRVYKYLESPSSLFQLSFSYNKSHSLHDPVYPVAAVVQVWKDQPLVS